MIELSAQDARRLAVRAQLLTEPRPTDLAATAASLWAVQVDATAYVAPSADLVFWSRLGDRVTRADLAAALDERALVEVHGFLRPADDVSLFLAEMAAWPGADPPEWLAASARWVEANGRARNEVLQQLRSDGPLTAKELSADFALDWRSSGWNNTKNIPMLLERLGERGEVAVSHRDGRERVWDLADRVYPDVAPVPLEQARHRRAVRRLRSLGIARAKTTATPVEPNDVGDIGLPARVEGVRGEWRVDAALLESAPPDSAPPTDAPIDAGRLRAPFAGRTALLSPLDRLVNDRKRLVELFDFDYALEMYKPAGARRWGYFALPVLHGDELVGKVDAEADHKGGMLRVRALHEDRPWTPPVRSGVEGELAGLAAFLDLELEWELGAP